VRNRHYLLGSRPGSHGEQSALGLPPSAGRDSAGLLRHASRLQFAQVGPLRVCDLQANSSNRWQNHLLLLRFLGDAFLVITALPFNNRMKPIRTNLRFSLAKRILK
jgi:hypothetical protein